MMTAYLELCKPRVVALMLLSAVVGMLLASPAALPDWQLLIAGLVGIGLTAAAGAAVNHLVDRRYDEVMKRTHNRPIPQGQVPPQRAAVFAGILALLGALVLWRWVNLLTLYLSLAAMLGYALVYTVFLKHATPQNIVIGGLSGALPPLLGWVAVSGQLDPQAWLLVLIIFAWTPPHFWALAIHRQADYANAKIPMLPVTHGIPFTKLCIVLYTILMLLATYLPHLIGMSHGIYLLGVSILNIRFLIWSLRLKRTDDPKIAMQTFRFSITYLMGVFLLLLVDHYVPLAIY